MTTNEPNPLMIWAMFFGQLVGIQAHPRNDDEIDLNRWSNLADEMMVYYEAAKERYRRASAGR